MDKLTDQEFFALERALRYVIDEGKEDEDHQLLTSVYEKLISDT